MIDNPAGFLCHARHKARHIHQRDKRNIKGITKTHKTGSLARGIDIQTPCQNHRLISDNTNGLPIHTCQTAQDIGRKILVNFKEILLIDHLGNHSAHIIGHIRIIRDNIIQHRRGSIGCICTKQFGRGFAIGKRQEAEQPSGLHQHIQIIGKSTMCHTRFFGMLAGTAQFFCCQIFMGDRLYHIRPGHKHIGRAFNHENEIRDGRRIYRPACTRPHHQRDLRHHTRGQNIPLKHFCIAPKRGHAFLDTRPA